MNSRKHAKFTIKDYCSYVGLKSSDVKKPNYATLAKLIKHHINKFRYQNSSIYDAGKCDAENRKIPSLEIDQLFELMTKQKSGYCFQHLELFNAVLCAIGFKVDRHLAKIILEPTSRAEIVEKPGKIKTHECLVVHIDEKEYFVDVGMGNLCLRAPIEFKEGIQTIGHDMYRLSKKDDTWSIDSKLVSDDDSKWFRYFRFFSAPVTKADVDAAHENMYKVDSVIPIRDSLFLLGQTTSEKRKYLLWDNQKHSGLFKSLKKSGKEHKSIEFDDFHKAQIFGMKKFGISRA